VSGNDAVVSDRTARHEKQGKACQACPKTFIAINVKAGEFALDVSRETVTAKNYRFKNYVSSLSLGRKQPVIDRNDDKASMKALTARLTLIAITGARMHASMNTARLPRNVCF
jgi:hypothetical protein